MIYLRPHSTIRSLNLNSIASGSTWKRRLFSIGLIFSYASSSTLQPRRWVGGSLTGSEFPTSEGSRLASLLPDNQSSGGAKDIRQGSQRVPPASRRCPHPADPERESLQTHSWGNFPCKQHPIQHSIYFIVGIRTSREVDSKLRMIVALGFCFFVFSALRLCYQGLNLQVDMGWSWEVEICIIHSGWIQTRSNLKSWRNLSALGSPRLWAITAFTEKVWIEKAIWRVWCTSINTSVAEEKAKARCLIMVVLLHAKSGRIQNTRKVHNIRLYL